MLCMTAAGTDRDVRNTGELTGDGEYSLDFEGQVRIQLVHKALKSVKM